MFDVHAVLDTAQPWQLGSLKERAGDRVREVTAPLSSYRERVNSVAQNSTRHDFPTRHARAAFVGSSETARRLGRAHKTLEFQTRARKPSLQEGRSEGSLLMKSEVNLRTSSFVYFLGSLNTRSCASTY